MTNYPKFVFLMTLPLLMLLAASLPGKMVSPAIDRPGQPFSHGSKSTGEIAIPDTEIVTEITPESCLRTGFGAPIFYSRPENEPADVRRRTLQQGRIPILHNRFERDGVSCRFTLFTSAVSDAPGHPPVNFVHMAVKSEGKEATRANLGAGIRYDAPNNTGAGREDNRFDRPREGRLPGDCQLLGESFSRNGVCSYMNRGFCATGGCSTPSPRAVRALCFHSLREEREEWDTALYRANHGV